MGLTLGQAFGYISCGIVPGAVIFAFNEALGKQILANVSEHFVEGFLQNLGILVQQSLTVGMQILFTETFKSVRKLIKSNSAVIAHFFGSEKLKKAIDAWGSEKSKPWSFASATQEFVDNTFGKEGVKAQFANQFLQQADQSCIEAGYVVANSLDSYISHQSVANQVVSPLGNERYVEITPNRKIPEERLLLAGQEEMLKPLIVQTLTTNQQFNGRDLGVIYGELQGELKERRYRPDVVLKFYKKQHTDKKTGIVSPALTMQISFRLMNKTVQDFATNTYLKVLAEQIYEEFHSPYQIHKGVEIYTYSDFQHGLQLKLDVNNEGEAMRVIKSILALTETPFNEAHFRVGSKPVEPVTTGKTIELQGKEVTLPINNKTGIVSFTHAYLNVGVNVPPINLVDLTGKKKNVVFKPTK